MSESTSAAVLKNASSDRSEPKDDGPKDETGVLVLEEVKEDLVSAGMQPAKAAHLAQRVITRVVSRVHIGPLPAVEDFEGYERICSGASRDILDMAIRQQRHSNWIEKAELLGEIGLKVLGLLAAVAAIAAMLFATVYCAVTGHEKAAIALGSGAGIASVAGVFLRNFLRGADQSTSQPKPKTKPKTKPKRGR